VPALTQAALLPQHRRSPVPSRPSWTWRARAAPTLSCCCSWRLPAPPHRPPCGRTRSRFVSCSHAITTACAALLWQAGHYAWLMAL